MQRDSQVRACGFSAPTHNEHVEVCPVNHREAVVGNTIAMKHGKHASVKMPLGERAGAWENAMYSAIHKLYTHVFRHQLVQGTGVTGHRVSIRHEIVDTVYFS